MQPSAMKDSPEREAARTQRRRALFWAVALLAATLIGLRLRTRQADGSGSPLLPAKVKSTATSPRPATVLPEASDGQDLMTKLQSTRASLLQDRAHSAQILRELQATLATMPRERTISAIRNFLDSRGDAPTGLSFHLGGKGALASAPTLRVFLLDYLGQVDPVAAAAYARVILQSMDSADEWAIALRSLAKGDQSPVGRALLGEKLGYLFANEAWASQPSVGYLESFDVAVYLGGTDFVPSLASMVRKQDNPAISRAAFLALDRLAIDEPGALLTSLAADPALMSGRELTRAGYFARADVRDPQQRQILESYLLNPQTGAEELQQFAGLYPNANFMISDNLLTACATPDNSTLAARDAQALRVTEEWLNDPRFKNLRPTLLKIRERLRGFVK